MGSEFVDFRTSSGGLSLETTAELAAFSKLFQASSRLHYLSSLEEKIRFDQVYSSLRVKREHLALCLTGSSASWSGIHLLIDSTCLNLNSTLRKGNSSEKDEL